MRARSHRFPLVMFGVSVLAGSLLAQSPSNATDESTARQAFDDSQKAWHRAQFSEALMLLTRVQKDYLATTVAAEAYLEAGRVLVALGYPASAMQELQQVRNRPWPKLLEADVATARDLALSRITLLQRIYLRSSAPFSGPPKPFGSGNLPNLLGIVVTAKNAVYWASERGVGPEAWAPLPSAKNLRGLTTDATGKPVVIDGGQLVGGPADVLKIARPGNKPEPLEKIDAAVQLASTRDWIVLDEDKGLLRFKNDGAYVGPFQPGQHVAKLTKLAINDFDEIAAIDAENPRVLLFNASGAEIGEIPDSKAEFKNPQDLTFDAFGHLYVIDQRTLAIFSPYAAAPGEASSARTPAAAPPARPGGSTNRGDAYQLRVRFSEPEKSKEGFHRATALAVDRSGAVYVYDKDLKQILVYR